jgi:hypothetical protein
MIIHLNQLLKVAIGFDFVFPGLVRCRFASREAALI